MGHPLTILLVDNDLHVREALGEALTDENYLVALAANGVEAVRHLESEGKRETRIDAALLDLTPRPENGWGLFSHLTTIRPDLPVIMMTAGRGEPLPATARTCVALMEKPLDVRQLIATLRTITAPREPVPERNDLIADTRSRHEKSGSHL